MERVTHNPNGFRTVSLFAGIGGFDLGFEFAGFNVVWANDFDAAAAATYTANVSENMVHGDIRELKSLIPPHDVLIGGFPCQPFSTLGKMQGFDDEKNRGTLFFDILDIIKKHDTKVVVLENVKNLINHDGGRTFEKIKLELLKAGYSVNFSVLNSCDYGVPQSRRRVFIVAFNTRHFRPAVFTYPPRVPLDVTTQDLLDENVPEKYFVTKKMLCTVMGSCKGWGLNPTIDQPISKTLTASMCKMHRATQDNYITDKVNFERNVTDKNRYSDLRRLTPNECRRLQGFPSDWKQVVSDTQAYRQFGNAVTVNVSYAVAVKVLKYMKNNLITV